MDPLLPVLSFLSIALGLILLILYFAAPCEKPVPTMSKFLWDFEGRYRYIVGPEIF